jgi:hypothetical protein
MKLDKFDIVHSLYNATNVGYDSVNDKWTATDKDGNSINVVSADVDAEFAKQEYKNKRQYPQIGEQLDLLWHSIDADADLKTKFANFYNAIKAVKDANPKPS